MRCGKPDHQPGQKCPAKNAKCKDFHKIGNFHKVCQTKKRAKQRANLVQTPQDDDDTHINENGVRQPNPPRVNMFKLVNHIEANRGRMEGKHLKFPVASHPKGPYKHHIVVRVDTGADVNCMNEKTFNEFFPEVQLSVCPHEIQNFRNSVADISILGQFCTYLEFKGEKYLNTFIVINVTDCPNLLSYGAKFRMGVLLPNYPEENVVKGENVPNFSKVNEGRAGNGTAHGMLHGTQHSISYANMGNGTVSGTPDGMSNVFQIMRTSGKMKSHTVPVQFQYGAHSTRDRNCFQDHHTLHTSSGTNDSKAGRFSTCTHKYFMEWTSSTLHMSRSCQTRRLISLEKSPTPTQWKDLCEQTPIDEARHSVTLFELL